MVYVLLADGFEEVEGLAPVDVLRRAGVPVKTAGVGGRRIRGAHGVPVETDVAVGEVAVSGLNDQFEMVVLPGGAPGYQNLEKSADAMKCVDFAFQNGRWVGANCAAPTVLGRRGLLKGRRAVCFPGMESGLVGAVPGGGRVCRDGRLVTGIGPGASLEFSLKLLECLKGAETAREVGASMQVRP